MLRLWRLVALPIFLGFVFLGAYLYHHLGGWREVVVDQTEQPALVLLYQVHRGAYHHINAVITAVETWAKDNQIPCARTFGEYLDDPRAVSEERLTSHGGCLLGETLRPEILPEGFFIETKPPAAYVRGQFQGSPAIGPWRVYPRLHQFIEQNGLKSSTRAIEIYTMLPEGGMATEYLIPIEANSPSQR